MTPERLARLTGEIRWHDSAAIGQNDIAWIKAERIALTEARAFVAANLRGTLECVCVLDPVTHEPIESTIDPEEVEHVAHIRGVLARIDAALEHERCHNFMSPAHPTCGCTGDGA